MRAIAILLGRAVTLAAILLGAVLDPSPALAHGGLVQLGVGPDGAGGLNVFAAYVEDGHPARGLALTATAIDGSARLGPLALRPAGEGEGFYLLGTGALPAGHWAVTVTGGPGQQVRPATTSVHVEAHPGGASPSVVAPTSTFHPKSAQEDASGAGHSSALALVAGGLATLTLLGAVSLLIARRRGSVHSAGKAPKDAPRSGQLIGRSG